MLRQTLIVVALFFGLSVFQSQAQEDKKKETAPSAKGKILLVIASQNFSAEEYKAIREGLTKSNYQVVVGSMRPQAVGLPHFTVNADVIIKEVKNLDPYIGIVFCGGSGIWDEYGESMVLPQKGHSTTINPAIRPLLEASRKSVKSLLDEAVKDKKLIGAICAAPVSALATAAVIKGKKVTGWAEKKDLDIFKKAGAIYTGKNVEVDENFITAKGEGLKEFVQTLINALDKQVIKK